MEIKYQTRASFLGTLVGNPLSYFKKDEPIPDNSFIRDGREREIISYFIFNDTDFNKEHGKYTAQVEGDTQIETMLITGHADIVGDDYVCDIKNSISSDEDLLKRYWYQLNAYAYMFGRKKAYLFVDTNEGNERDIKKTRFIEVPVDYEKFEKVIKGVINVLDANTLNKSYDSTKDLNIEQSNNLYHLFQELEIAKNNEEKAKKQQEEIRAQIEEHMKKNGEYSLLSKNYEAYYIYQKDLKRKPYTISYEPWDYTYKLIFKVRKL